MEQPNGGDIYNLRDVAGPVGGIGHTNYINCKIYIFPTDSQRVAIHRSPPSTPTSSPPTPHTNPRTAIGRWSPFRKSRVHNQALSEYEVEDVTVSLLDQAVADTYPCVYCAPNGSVRAGTFVGFVDYLVQNFPDQRIQEFKEVFMTTYPLVIKADVFYELLVQKYADSSRMLSQHRICLNIISLMKCWAEMPHVLVDGAVLSRMREFAGSVVTVGDPLISGLAAWIIEQIDNRINTRSDIGSSFSNSQVRRPNNIQPCHLASALATLEVEIYQGLIPADCIHHIGRSSSPNVMAAITLHNQILLWVENSIMRFDRYVDRANEFLFFVEAAQECRKIGNFSSLAAIAIALQSEVISRLNVTMKEVEKRQSNWKTRLGCAGIIRDVSTYFTEFDAARNICVPWIAVHLHDIKNKMFDKASVDLEQGRALINISHFTHNFNSIRDLLKCTSKFKQTHFPDLLAYLSSRLHSNYITEDQLKKRSIELAAIEETIMRGRKRELTGLGFSECTRTSITKSDRTCKR